MINAVVKAVRIMGLFSPDEPRLSLTDIATRLNMPKSTVHNLLNTLVSEGYVERVGGDRYALGTAIIGLTQNVRVNVEIRDRAAPLLRQLADSANESVYLTVKDGASVLYIYAIESSQRLIARTAVGDRAPLYCTSVGKAILSRLPEAAIDALYVNQPMPRFTPNTITDVEVLKADLALTLERGYAIDNQEHEENVFCVGAPILDAQGHPIAACSISGIDTEIVGARLQELAAGVMQTAEQISRHMGHVPTRRSRARVSVTAN